MNKIISALMLVLGFASFASAQCVCQNCQCNRQPIRNVVGAAVNIVTGSVDRVDDALAEVNAARARRGLKPFLPDPNLNLAARRCAMIRAQGLIAGHLSNDFAQLPPGTHASSAGCGALEDSWGWGTCCTYENYTYAGAAWVRGADNKRYMHIFCR